MSVYPVPFEDGKVRKNDFGFMSFARRGKKKVFLSVHIGRESFAQHLTLITSNKSIDISFAANIEFNAETLKSVPLEDKLRLKTAVLIVKFPEEPATSMAQIEAARQRRGGGR